jgi:hypothetical protein
MSELQRCKGTNCGCTDGVSHSAECRAEHDALCFQAEIGDLRAEVARLTAERDEARRIACSAYAEWRRDLATERNWDCFEKEEAKP